MEKDAKEKWYNKKATTMEEAKLLSNKAYKPMRRNRLACAVLEVFVMAAFIPAVVFGIVSGSLGLKTMNLVKSRPYYTQLTDEKPTDEIGLLKLAKDNNDAEVLKLAKSQNSVLITSYSFSGVALLTLVGSAVTKSKSKKYRKIYCEFNKQLKEFPPEVLEETTCTIEQPVGYQNSENEE